ncbi:MAG: TonB-dependent receptor [Gammaproteobacteria bacterium]|nr:TonB-dependent receptor [Gammaproteobacteria bacterium]
MEQGTDKNHGRHHAQQAWPRRPGISRIKHALRSLSVLPWLLLAHPSTGLATTLPDDLTSMGLEALMNIEVTSVAKKPQKKSEAAAAVFVITSKDLRRWGVTNIPDALRRVPGLQVARIDANKWAITSRGFNSRFANKLLVLIDGRTVYTPLFAGVYWDANLVMLEDVEQIEIIRGPGGTLWGANAVNGVINIITRSAADTQGTLVSAAAGNELERLVNVRHGGTTGSGAHYRVYAMSRANDSGFAAPGAHDDAEIAQAGFRTDWSTGEADSHTLQGDYYRGTAGQELLIAPSAPATITDDADTEGGNLLYRWTHRSGNGSDIILQAYVDYVGRESAVLFEDRYTLDLELQHHFAWNDRHDVVWGLNYRSIDDDTEATQIFSLAPAERRVDLVTGFIQDEIGLFSEQAKLTLGTKLEHNDFTGFEVQPNIRLAWLTDSGNTVWGAVSRAVRTPARGEHDVSLTVLPPPSPPGLPPLTINGNSGYDTEKLVAWEIGLRRVLADSVTLDATAFYNRYDELRTIEITSMPPGPFTAIFDNNMEGNTQGFEIDVHWQARSWLSVNANYTRLEIDLDLVNGSMDTTSLSAEQASPEHQANLWIAADLDNNVQLDAGLRYVDSLQNPGFAKTGDYLAFDARLAWMPAPGIELSLVGQNLFDNHHPEFNPDFIISTPTEVERSVHGTVSWTFR